MNQGDLQRCRMKLLMMRDRLNGEVPQMVESVRAAGRPVGEHDDIVSESTRKELALEGTEEELRHEVVAALRRIDEGEYGKCQTCGHSIPRERLAAIPHARHCIACERRLEAALSEA